MKRSVSLDANGGSVSPANKEVTYGEAIGTLTTLTRSGYTFDGWFTEQSGGTQVTSDSTAWGPYWTGTYYAHWTLSTRTVTFNANGGSVSPTSKTVNSGAAVGELPAPTRTGYTFGGWYTEESGGTQVTAETKVTTAGDHSLHAQWTANVTLVPNGVTVAGNGVTLTQENGNYILHTKGNEIDLDSLTVTAGGGTFNGWFDNEVPMFGTVQTNIAAGAAPMLLAASTTHYITLMDDETVLGSLLAYNGQPLPGLSSIPSKSGYTFNGYWTETSGGTQYYDANGFGKINSYDGGVTELYAQWTEQTKISITATADPVGSGTVTDGQTSIVPGTQVSLTATPGAGYTFDGWYIGNTRVSTSTTYTFTADKSENYTAKFTAISSMRSLQVWSMSARYCQSVPSKSMAL